MTAQAREILIYKGKKYGMATEPLEPYIEANDIRFSSMIECSGCWRGYIGTWSIEDNRLYLIDIDTDDNGKKVKLEDLFPNQEKVFADWFTGELHIPYGKLMKYVHQGYASLYEKELFLNVQKGIVISEREIDNTHYYDDLKGMEERNNDDLWGAIFGSKRKKSQKATNRIKLWLNKILER